MENKNAPIIEAVNACISNPETKCAVKDNKHAFIISVNNPRVAILIGKNKINAIGFINALTKPITNTATIEAVTLTNSMPGTIQPIENRPNANNIHFTSKLTILFRVL